jgi:protein Tex
MMSHKFIKDPRELVKAGDVVKVKVLEVDLQRRRIALTMKLDEAPARGRPEPQGGARGASPPSRPQQRGREQERRPSKPRESESQSNGVMAEALARAFKR